MAEARHPDKVIRRDQHATREIREELDSERGANTSVKPRQENVNRDRARGDRDRSGTGSGAGPEPPAAAEVE